MTIMNEIIELVKLISLMVFVSSVAAQVWIAFLDITKYFTNILEKFRPKSEQDKYSRITVIIGAFILLIK